MADLAAVRAQIQAAGDKAKDKNLAQGLRGTAEAAAPAPVSIPKIQSKAPAGSAPSSSAFTEFARAGASKIGSAAFKQQSARQLTYSGSKALGGGLKSFTGSGINTASGPISSEVYAATHPQGWYDKASAIVASPLKSAMQGLGYAFGAISAGVAAAGNIVTAPGTAAYLYATDENARRQGFNKTLNDTYDAGFDVAERYLEGKGTSTQLGVGKALFGDTVGATAFNFVLDNLLDPSNYITLGTGTGAKVAGKGGEIVSLSAQGTKVFKTRVALDIAKGMTKEAAQAAAKQGVLEMIEAGAKTIDGVDIVKFIDHGGLKVAGLTVPGTPAAIQKTVSTLQDIGTTVAKAIPGYGAASSVIKDLFVSSTDQVANAAAKEIIEKYRTLSPALFEENRGTIQRLLKGLDDDSLEVIRYGRGNEAMLSQLPADVRSRADQIYQYLDDLGDLERNSGIPLEKIDNYMHQSYKEKGAELTRKLDAKHVELEAKRTSGEVLSTDEQRLMELFDQGKGNMKKYKGQPDFVQEKFFTDPKLAEVTGLTPVDSLREVLESRARQSASAVSKQGLVNELANKFGAKLVKDSYTNVAKDGIDYALYGVDDAAGFLSRFPDKDSFLEAYSRADTQKLIEDAANAGNKSEVKRLIDDIVDPDEKSSMQSLFGDMVKGASKDDVVGKTLYLKSQSGEGSILKSGLNSTGKGRFEYKVNVPPSEIGRVADGKINGSIPAEWISVKRGSKWSPLVEQTLGGLERTDLRQIYNTALSDNAKLINETAKSAIPDAVVRKTASGDSFYLPREVNDALNKYYTKTWDINQLPAGARKTIEAYDKSTQFFKSLVTSPFPAFTTRNVADSTFREALDVGLMQTLRPDITVAAAKGALNKGIDDVVQLGGASYTVGELRKVAGRMGVINSGEVAQTGLQSLRNVTDPAENYTRLHQFMVNLDKTGDYVAAADRVKKFQFDYSNLSDFEKGVMQRVFPFYTFTRKNIPFQVGQLITNPGKFNVVQNAYDALRQEFGTTDPNAVPDYISSGYSVPIGNDGSGNTKYLGELGLSYEAANKGLNVFTKRGIESNVLSSMNPALKFAGEIVSKKNFFTGNDFDSPSGRDAKGQKVVLKGLNALFPDLVEYSEGTKTNYDGSTTDKYMANPYAISLVSNLPTARLTNLVSNFTREDKTAGENASQLLTGLKVYNVNDAEQADTNAYYDAADKVKAQVSALEAMGFIKTRSDGKRVVNYAFSTGDTAKDMQWQAKAQELLAAQYNPTEYVSR